MAILCWVTSLLLSTCVLAARIQLPLAESGDTSPQGSQHRRLHGRFLQITDFHPDSHYKAGSSIGRNCHDGSGRAGHFGSPGTDCDSPWTLVDATMDWIRDNLRDSIDFVIWTGDSARHDNDEDIPRSEKDIIESNKLMVKKLLDVFAGSDKSGKAHARAKLRIPVIPTIGNNDIMPHNIFEGGPNRWTKAFNKIWDPFIPEEQRHSFAEGGWFYVEAIPNKLAVFSLNTMYFYKANAAVDGCKFKSEPGYEHMDWLRIQLQILRERNMKAILIGHVPPARTKERRNWYESCWQKYALWMRQYRDVVVGSMYGHMNVDHFIVQDFSDLKIENNELPPDIDDEPVDFGDEERLSIRSKLDYLSSLRDSWSKLPSPPPGYSPPLLNVTDEPTTERKKSKKKEYLEAIGGPWAERYSLSFVAPSIIPVYYPTLRVVEYNISGLEDSETWAQILSEPYSGDTQLRDSDGLLDSDDSSTPEDLEPLTKRKKKNKKKKKKSKFKTPKPPPTGTTPGPAYADQQLSWIGFTQYFANLTHANKKVGALRGQPSSSMDFTGFRHYLLNKQNDASLDFDVVKHNFRFEVEYDTKTDAVYRLQDMTVNSYLDLARRIAGVSSKVANPDESNPLESKLPSDITSQNSPLAQGHMEHSAQAEGTGNFTPRRHRAWKTFVQRAFVGFQDP